MWQGFSSNVTKLHVSLPHLRWCSVYSHQWEAPLLSPFLTQCKFLKNNKNPHSISTSVSHYFHTIGNRNVLFIFTWAGNHQHVNLAGIDNFKDSDSDGRTMSVLCLLLILNEVAAYMLSYKMDLLSSSSSSSSFYSFGIWVHILPLLINLFFEIHTIYYFYIRGGAMGKSKF